MEKISQFQTYEKERQVYQLLKLFYDRLPQKKDIFYMFYTKGLLPFVLKSIEFLPSECRLVLISSNLTLEEKEFSNQHLSYPILHIPFDFDDKILWNVLLKVNLFNFGWLDCDTFIYHPDLLDKMKQMNSDTVMNGYWYEKFFGERLINTYLLYINVNLAAKIGLTFYKYTDNLDMLSQMSTLRPPKQTLGALSERIPLGIYNSGFEYDTSILFQLYASCIGYKTHIVSLEPNKAAHVGASIIFSRLFNDFDRKMCTTDTVLIRPLLVGEALTKQFEKILPQRYQDYAYWLNGLFKEFPSTLIEEVKRIMRIRKIPRETILEIGRRIR